MDIYNQMAVKIIEQQESTIGPMAVQRAMGISNLAINWTKHQVTIMGNDGPGTIDMLVGAYKLLLGGVSVETCKNAAAPLLSQLPVDKQPKSLR